MCEEVWKPIPGFGGEYEASTCGRIRSVSGYRLVTTRYRTFKRWHKGTLRKPAFDGRGMYLQVNLSTRGKQRMYLVHRLIAITFLENPKGLPEVNHMDEDKTNNAVWNLEWCDHKYNNNYGSKIASSQGTRNGASKYNEELVRKIRAEYVPNDAEHGLTSISKKYGVSLTHVYNIVNGYRWGWLD